MGAKKQKTEIPAVHRDDLEPLLAQLGVLIGGSLVAACSGCDDPLTLDSLAGIQKVGEDYVLTCSKRQCLEKRAIS
jgi:hypothetical protein